MKYKNPELLALSEKKLSPTELLHAMDEVLTNERQKNKKMGDEHERLSVIIDLIPNTISWVNSDMTYFGVNKALAETCGVTPDDFIGKKIGFHTKERFFYEFVTELFRSNSNTIYRELEARIGGVDHIFLVSGTKLQDKKKAVVIGVDITELTKLKGHLSFTEKLATLGEMFAGIIHDINNPLMMIEDNTRRIQKNIKDEETKELLNKIELSSKKIGKIVHGISVFTHEDVHGPMEKENIATILDDALAICEHKLKENFIAVRLDQKLQKAEVACHMTMIFQVFVNLINNSVEAVKNVQDKWIEFSVRENTDKKLTIAVIDSGVGIPKDLQDKIFTAFYTTKDKGIGSGLGLSLSRKILEAHGGSLTIDNSGNHTCFLMSFSKN